MRTVLLAITIAASLSSHYANASDDSAADEAIQEAIVILEARKAKSDNKADQERIGAAIASLDKLLKVETSSTPAAALPNISPALLKKKFKAKAAFDLKTSELTLIYEFKNSTELADFDLEGAKPNVSNGLLKLEGARRITNLAHFKSVSINGSISVVPENFTSRIGTSKGASLNTTTTTGGQFFSISIDSKEVAFERTNAMSSPFELAVEPGRVAVKWGQTQLAKPTSTEQGGQVQLHGGLKGTQFSKMIITGRIDPEWAKMFFAE